MIKRKSSLRKTIVTNIALAAIILLVYFAAFMPFSITKGPVIRGNTNGNNVALQIGVKDGRVLPEYLDILDRFGVKATFFFPEHVYSADENLLSQVKDRGNGTGYYPGGNGKILTLYVGCGYSIPVMSCVSGSRIVQVCPSIDVALLKEQDGWQETFAENLHGDMFVYASADGDPGDFEKIVQIVLNKGYTILKMDEML